ncbi:hypothetical protein [Snodgrassella sp. CS2]|uniref:hypothetical protein n=1 Tax=Snodgrassella sp. CS2 TaxID=3418953 RepID=UPI003D032D45
MVINIINLFNHVSWLIKTKNMQVELRLFKALQNDYGFNLTVKVDGQEYTRYFSMIDNEFFKSESIKEAEDAIKWINQFCDPLDCEIPKNKDFDLLIYLVDVMNFPYGHTVSLELNTIDNNSELFISVSNTQIKCNSPTYICLPYSSEGIDQGYSFLMEKHFAYATNS